MFVTFYRFLTVYLCDNVSLKHLTSAIKCKINTYEVNSHNITVTTTSHCKFGVIKHLLQTTWLGAKNSGVSRNLMMCMHILETMNSMCTLHKVSVLVVV